MMSGTEETRLQLAKAIAVEGGELAVRMRLAQTNGFTERKSHQDFVTAADRAVEQHLRKRIAQRFPTDAVLGEEEGYSGASPSLWIIDPIDGTTNYMRGMPEWAVSIGHMVDGKLNFGVIHAPDLALTASAADREGATLNTERTDVSGCAEADQALVLLGRSDRNGGAEYLDCIRALLASGTEYRRNGSAAYSLLAVAGGRADAFYEAHLNPWDAAAGLLIIKEAGGKVSHPPLKDFLARGGPVLACNSGLNDTLAAIIPRSFETT